MLGYYFALLFCFFDPYRTNESPVFSKWWSRPQSLWGGSLSNLLPEPSLFNLFQRVFEFPNIVGSVVYEVSPSCQLSVGWNIEFPATSFFSYFWNEPLNLTGTQIVEVISCLGTGVHLPLREFV